MKVIQKQHNVTEVRQFCTFVVMNSLQRLRKLVLLAALVVPSQVTVAHH